VMNRRKGASAKAAASVESGGAVEPASVAASAPVAIAPDKPAPGVKPTRPTGRPSGKRSPRR
jgi:preprotein translocase subunit SecF